MRPRSIDVGHVVGGEARGLVTRAHVVRPVRGVTAPGAPLKIDNRKLVKRRTEQRKRKRQAVRVGRSGLNNPITGMNYLSYY